MSSAERTDEPTTTYEQAREELADVVRRLEAGGVPVTVRDTRGQEIDGACGQLAATER